MNGANGVPVWIPILVGALGMLGVLGGQAINAWREGVRWKRELKREDLRWRRDQQKESASWERLQAEETARREHESVLDWRTRRIDLYGEVLGSLREAQKILQERYRRSITNPEGNIDLTDLSNKLDEAIESYERVADKVSIIGSPELVEQTSNLPLLVLAEIDSNGKTWGTSSDLSEAISIVIRKYDNLSEIMRSELRIESSSARLG